MRSGMLFLGSPILLAGLLVAINAQATPLGPEPELDMAGWGMDLAAAGVGLENLGSDVASIDISIGGPVLAAYLYWAGREFDCDKRDGKCIVTLDPPYKDQVVVFDGHTISGDIIGAEQSGSTLNVGYRANVTNYVRSRGFGTVSFSVEDGDTASNLDRLNGASLLVMFRNFRDLRFYRVTVYDGLDYAYFQASASGETTDPAVFRYRPRPMDRTAHLLVVVGDCESDRPDRVEISDNVSPMDQLDGSDGAEWDNDFIEILIPAGVDETTVEVVSPEEGPRSDSLLWQVAAMKIPWRGVETPQ